MRRENQKINASLVEFGSPNHKLLAGYEFSFADEEKTILKIKKPSGEFVTPNPVLGQDFNGLGEISLDDANDLIIGKYKVHQGINLAPGWTAKRSQGKKVKIKDPSGNEHLGVIGEHFSPLNAFISGKDQLGNLTLKGQDSEFSIKHLTKTKTITLTVLKDKDGTGFKAFMGEKLPAKKGGDQGGIDGLFYDKTDTTPAYFTTKVCGVEVATAIFELDKEKNITNVRMYKVDKALELKKTKIRMSAIANECRKFDLLPQDHQEFVRLKEKANDIKMSSAPAPFDVAIGQYYFGLEFGNKANFKSRKKTMGSYSR